MFQGVILFHRVLRTVRGHLWSLPVTREGNYCLSVKHCLYVFLLFLAQGVWNDGQ